ncbi:LysR family transcriptional regulator [Shewanella intestini]|uniref:LysR family transcriptional regulator n=1 Tax=Shewanella intestini TaxID=2017544 RepID=A0ABS5I4E3_9GAMM|nr:MULTISPECIES: LysR family transcriptional regulator [Shewanella]MBR9728781.1 LysR family transcriptional regulator [Shewanella intestini]MRG36856.1 LysR family transcriptional regulator [Shewanella sp. XMDDZSB0408]
MKTEDITLFHRIVETGSLVEAADMLNLPKSTLSRRLQQLEDELKVKLFHRQSRSMTLTASGSHFYDKSLQIMTSLQQAVAELTDKQTDIDGHLRILIFPIPELIYITEAILSFMDINPSITVEVIVSAEPQDMIRNNIDLAFMLEDSFNENDMVARHIIDEPVIFLASPAYLAKAGRPIKAGELSEHNLILFRYPNGKIFNEVPFGINETLKVTGNFCVNNLEVCLAATLSGRGISMMPLTYCQQYIERGQVVRLFEDVPPYVGKCFLVYPSRRYISLASQRFIDYVMKSIESRPYERYCQVE